MPLAPFGSTAPAQGVLCAACQSPSSQAPQWHCTAHCPTASDCTQGCPSAGSLLVPSLAPRWGVSLYCSFRAPFFLLCWGLYHPHCTCKFLCLCDILLKMTHDANRKKKTPHPFFIAHMTRPDTHCDVVCGSGPMIALAAAQLAVRHV